MYEDRVVSFSHPDRVSIADPLTQVLRSGARRLMAETVEADMRADGRHPNGLFHPLPTAPLVSEGRGPWTKRGKVRPALRWRGQNCTPIGGHFCAPVDTRSLTVRMSR